jgi:nucleotide-binding universal stress UspA family protein
MLEIKKILFPCDLTVNSAKILTYVRSVSEKYGSTFYLFHVVEELSKWGNLYVPHASLDVYQKEALEGAGKAMATFCEDNLRDCLNYEKKVAIGDPVAEILKAIDSEGIDLVIMGTHGRKGLEHTIFGSVAENVVRRSPVPVLTLNPHKL